MGSDDVRLRQQRKRRRSNSCSSQSSIDSESRSYHRLMKMLCDGESIILLDTGPNVVLRQQSKRRRSLSCLSHSSIESEPSSYRTHIKRSYMDKPARYKAKNKKSTSPKQKTTKKKKNDGPTCSMFLAELTRKLAVKRRQEEESPKNIVQTIIDNITNALPFKFSRKSLEKRESPMQIETLQTYAPELMPNDVVEILQQPTEEEEVLEVVAPEDKHCYKVPRMPVANSEIIKVATEQKKRAFMQDVSVNTCIEHDMASEIVKHVGTLKRISLIAEEFNQKTAKNLKEIVDSVQEDLIKKLEEIREKQKLQQQAEKLMVEQEMQKE